MAGAASNGTVLACRRAWLAGGGDAGDGGLDEAPSTPTGERAEGRHPALGDGALTGCGGVRRGDP